MALSEKVRIGIIVSLIGFGTLLLFFLAFVGSTGTLTVADHSVSVGSISSSKSLHESTSFENYGINPFVSTEDEMVSTFGMDVDTASYSIAREWLHTGVMPDKDSVRTEEFVNYFDQKYKEGDGTFSIHLEGAESEFGQPHYHLLKIGVRAKDISSTKRKPANVILVVDVSGSMEQEGRLELVKRSIQNIVGDLKQGDRVGLVTYGDEAQKVLDLTKNKGFVLHAAGKLTPRGSTNAEAGLIIAYEMAAAEFEEDKVNRIILFSDGVANVGATSAQKILEQVKVNAKKGITLTTLGFGLENYNDVLMEKLANQGDGSYYYINSQEEIGSVFSQDMSQVLGFDAKVQVDFNEEVVERFRLLGYENRQLESDDFMDDTIDAGEVSAGQSVTALYEIRIKDDVSELDEVARVKIRYTNLDDDAIEQTERVVNVKDMANVFSEASAAFRFTAAVAEFAEILRESYWAKEGSLEHVLEVAGGSYWFFGSEGEEFVDLVKRTIEIKSLG